MQRPGAAEGDEAELARIEAALDGDEPDRLDHVRVRDPQDALGRLLDVSPSGSAMRDSIASRARSTSSSMRPSRNRSFETLPSTSCASVFVGSVPPLP